MDSCQGEHSCEAAVDKGLNTLSSIDPDTDGVVAVVESPRGSRNKYDCDPKIQAFRLASVLPQGRVFHFDFGFIPSTKADDGVKFVFAAGARRDRPTSVETATPSLKKEIVVAFLCWPPA
jgi:Inorganic pyrophosphatase